MKIKFKKLSILFICFLIVFCSLKVDVFAVGFIGNGKYNIKGLHTQGLINGYSITASKFPSGLVTAPADGSKEQVIILAALGDGSYTLKVDNYGGKYIYLESGARQYSKLKLSSTTYSRFIIEHRSNNQYFIRSADNPNLVLTTRDATVYSHNYIELENYHDWRTQLWTFNKVGDLGGSSNIGTVAGSLNQKANLNSSFYKAPFNILAKSGYTGQCTWYVYGRVYEVNPSSKWNIARNANLWLTMAQKQSYATGSSPRANSIAVWGRSSTGGHVAFVEATNSDGSIIITEANSGWGSTPGVPYQVTKKQFQQRANELGFLGYIYLP